MGTVKKALLTDTGKMRISRMGLFRFTPIQKQKIIDPQYPVETNVPEEDPIEKAKRILYRRMSDNFGRGAYLSFD